MGELCFMVRFSHGYQTVAITFSTALFIGIIQFNQHVWSLQFTQVYVNLKVLDE